MIKFFRHVRKKLLSEGKFSKYLTYAFGEIVLVVIGILIALQINTWNEEHKAKIEEEKFFENILLDLEKDEDKLLYYKKFYSKRVIYIDTLLTYLRNPTKTMGIEKFGMYVEPLYYNENPVNYATTFESAKSLGGVNNFKEKELLKNLSQYYADFALIESLLTSTTRVIESQLEPILAQIPEGYISEKTGSLVINEEKVAGFYKKIAAIEDLRDINIDYQSILNDPRFENYLIGDMGRAFNTLGKIEKRIKALNQIKNQLRSND